MATARLLWSWLDQTMQDSGDVTGIVVARCSLLTPPSPPHPSPFTDSIDHTAVQLSDRDDARPGSVSDRSSCQWEQQGGC